MTDIPKEEIRKKLERAITRTKEDIEEYKEMTAPIAPENSIGRVSRMDAINNKSVAEAALRTAESKLHQLEFMLGKIDDADFGRCAKCGQSIPIQRLLLMPQNQYCVHCAS